MKRVVDITIKIICIVVLTFVINTISACITSHVESSTDVVEPAVEEQVEPEIQSEVQPEVQSKVESEVSADVLDIDEPEPATATNIVHINFSFVGDVMLADYKGQRTKDGFFDYYDAYGPEWFFDKVKHYFKEDDFTIVNVENVFTDRDLSEKAKDEDPGYWYKAPTVCASPLVNAGVEVADLNNNHVGDYGTAGKNDTIETLDILGITSGSYMRPCYFSKGSIIIGMVCAGLWNDYQAEQLIGLVKEVKSKCDICIVYFHGGEMFVHQPDSYKIKGAHNAIDAGADLVVGSHPHCLQPSEIYNDKLIVYSLGNFCYGGSKKPENRTVILDWNIDVDFDTREMVSYGYSFIPCYVYTGDTNNFQPAPIEDPDEREAVIDFMYGETNSPFKE